MNKKPTHYDVLIIWWWVSGTALLYTLSNFTNIWSIGLIEKYSKSGLVNSKSTNNSQTLHSGDIETNYTLAKATKVKIKADMLKHFCEEYKREHGKEDFFHVYNKMILAIWDTEVKDLEHRFHEFKELFPLLKKLTREELTQAEPLVMKDRDPNEKVLALQSPEWYTIDYGKLTEIFVEKSIAKIDEHSNSVSLQGWQTVDTFFDTKIENIIRTESGYTLFTQDWREFRCKVLIVSAGWHTPLIAQSLWYAKNYSILSVAWSFFKSTRKILNGKVYTMQVPKLPFAAVHGDPDVYNEHETRFWPTAKGIFMLERYNYSSVWEYFKVFGFKWKSFKLIFSLMIDRVVWPYLFRNFRYDIPRIGKRLFLSELKKIIPSLKASDIEHGDKLGGTRPQILNLDTMQLEMWEAKIIWDQIIFNITPSPGATTCLANAYDDTQKIIEFLKGEFGFDKKEFEKRYVP